MQAILEPIFDAGYLITVMMIGLIMIISAKDRPYYRLFGIMAVILGGGDAFHLIPRIVALRTTGFESHAAALGFGKFVTSITMTIFYLILYILWKKRYQIKGSNLLDLAVGGLAAVRMALCFFPQNMWFSYAGALDWAVYRNLPFAVIGILMIVLWYRKGALNSDDSAKKIAIAVALSFAFYIPVVLWGHKNVLVGMLMIPKTMAYLWIVFIGFREFKKQRKPVLRNPTGIA